MPDHERRRPSERTPRPAREPSADQAAGMGNADRAQNIPGPTPSGSAVSPASATAAASTSPLGTGTSAGVSAAATAAHSAVGTSSVVGSGHTPRRISNPQPVVPNDQRRTVLGVQIIGHGVSPSAMDACAAFVESTLSQRVDVQERLRRARVALVIIPRDKKMTDLPEFASLRGTNTFDGRVWDDVRGSGGMQSGGLWAIGVPEENLIVAPDGRADQYGDGYNVGLHEFAHTIHSQGVSEAERRTMTELYAARQAAGGPWTESYGASNEAEYFAQSTNCFFEQNGNVGQNSAAWLETNDPAMFAFLVRIYGRPPASAAAAPPAPGSPPPASPPPTSPPLPLASP